MTGSSFAANGWPGRAPEVGVVWVLLGGVIFYYKKVRPIFRSNPFSKIRIKVDS